MTARGSGSRKAPSEGARRLRQSEVGGPGSKSRGQIVPLPDLLQNLCDGRRTGTLILTGPRTTVYLYLEAGTLAAAYDGDDEFLGKALVKSGALAWSELAKFREFFAPTPVTIERLLLEHGVVGADALREAHAFFVREILCEALTWEAPETRFHDGPPAPVLARVNLPHAGVAVPTKPAIMAGVYQLDEWTRIRAQIPSDRDVLAVVEGVAPPDGVPTWLLSEVDGERTAEEVVVRARLGRFDTYDALRAAAEAGAVRCLGRDELVELADRLRSSARSEGAVRERLILLYERAEALGHDSVEVGLWLAQAHERRGDAEEAGSRYVELGRRLGKDPAAAERATDVFRRALRLRPEDGSLQRELIVVLLGQGRLEEAALQTEEYVGWLRSAHDPLTAFKLARELLRQLQEFEEMVVLLADLAAESGNRAEALSLYRKVCEIRLSSPDFSPEEKVEALDRLLGLDPRDLDAHYALIQLLAEVSPGDAPSAIRTFAEVVRDREHNDCEPRLIEAFLLLEQLEPGPEVAAQLALACIECSRWEPAEQRLRELLEASQALPSTVLPAYRRLHLARPGAKGHLLYARALVLAGETARGVAEYKAIGERSLKSKNQASAAKAFRMALESAPFDAELRAALVEVEADDGAQARNLRAIAHIAAIDGDAGRRLDALQAYLSARPGDRAAAHELAQVAAEVGGPEGLEALGRFARQSSAEGNLGDVRWAAAAAKRLGAPPAWFAGLPS